MMDSHLSMEWDTILGVFDRMPSFPVTLIDNEVLDEWGAHPTIWEAQPKQWHAWRVLAMVCYTLPTGQNHSPAVVYGATFVFIPSRQVHTTLSDALQFLRFAKEDSVVLVSTPKIPAFSLEPKNGQYMTLLPISSNPDIDRGPLHSFAAAILPKSSNEGAGPKMAVRVKLLPCFRSSKHSRTEMLTEEALTWGPLWPNVHFVEHDPKGKIICGQDGKPTCQTITVKLVVGGFKVKYTDPEGLAAPLTLAAGKTSTTWPRW